MRVTVKLFARARELGGGDAVDVEVPAGATVGELRECVRAQVPALAGFVGRCAVAVDGEYVVDADILGDGREVALIPPVSGG